MMVTAYGMLAGLTLLLQADRTRRSGTADGMSMTFLSTHVIGYGLWLVYGLSIRSTPLIVVDATGLACGVVALIAALTTRRRSIVTVGGIRPAHWRS